MRARDLKVDGISAERRIREQDRGRGRVGPGGQGPGVRDHRAAEKNRENVPAARDTLSQLIMRKWEAARIRAAR